MSENVNTIENEVKSQQLQAEQYQVYVRYIRSNDRLMYMYFSSFTLWAYPSSTTNPGADVATCK